MVATNLNAVLKKAFLGKTLSYKILQSLYYLSSVCYECNISGYCNFWSVNEIYILLMKAWVGSDRIYGMIL